VLGESRHSDQSTFTDLLIFGHTVAGNQLSSVAQQA